MPNEFSVSVIIPAYNSEDSIARAINSVLTQTVGVTEIIIIDDGSSDNTVGEVQRLAESCSLIQLIQQPNGGPAKARNTGIENATSEWIAFLDADDIWLPNRLESQNQIIERYPNLAWVSGAYTSVKFDAAGHANEVEESSKSTNLKQSDDGLFDALEEIVNGTTIWTGSMLIRRDELLTLKGFEPTIKGSEDIDLWVRLALRNPKIGFVTQPIAHYTVDQPNSVVGANIRDLDMSKFVFYKRVGDFAEKSNGPIRKRLENLIKQKIQYYTNGLLRAGESGLVKQFVVELKKHKMPLPALTSRVVSFVPSRILKSIRSTLLHRK